MALKDFKTKRALKKKLKSDENTIYHLNQEKVLLEIENVSLTNRLSRAKAENERLKDKLETTVGLYIAEKAKSAELSRVIMPSGSIRTERTEVKNA